MCWCFAKINNRLAEIFWEEKNNKSKIMAHCYVNASEYKTKKEQKWIKNDTEKFQLTYRKGKYKFK